MIIYKCDKCKQEYDPNACNCLSGNLFKMGDINLNNIIQMNLCESCSKGMLEFVFGDSSSETNEKVPIKNCPSCGNIYNS